MGEIITEISSIVPDIIYYKQTHKLTNFNSTMKQNMNIPYDFYINSVDYLYAKV